MKVVALFIIALLSPLQVLAGDIMKGLFEDNLRINTTSPGSANNGTSYGYAFGGASVRIRQMNANIVTFTPPSLSAGCAGIDFFAGSFSLMSRDEAVQMARAIMQGGASYAFGLALDSICPSCNDEMKALKKELDRINGLLKGSCKDSERALESLPLGIGDWAKNQKDKTPEIAATGEKEGLWVDRLFGNTKTENEPVTIASNDKLKKLVSINWMNEALSKFEDDWLSSYGFNEEDGKGFILAIMGSTIHRLEAPLTTDGADGKAVPLSPLFGMQDFISGRIDEENLTIYKCKEYDSFPAKRCLDVEEKPTEMTSLESYHFKKIAGTAAGHFQDGLGYAFYRYQNSGAQAPTEADWAYMKSFDIDLVEMFEIMGNDGTLVESLSRWVARTQSIKQGYSLLTRLRKEFMKLTQADFSDRQGLLAEVAYKVPLRIEQLRSEIKDLNEIEVANKVSIGNAINQYKDLRKRIIIRNSEMLTQG